MNHARLFLPLKKGGGGEGGRRERMDWTNGEIDIWLGPGNAVQDVSVKAHHNPTVFFKLGYCIPYCILPEVRTTCQFFDWYILHLTYLLPSLPFICVLRNVPKHLRNIFFFPPLIYVPTKHLPLRTCTVNFSTCYGTVRTFNISLLQ